MYVSNSMSNWDDTKIRLRIILFLPRLCVNFQFQNSTSKLIICLQTLCDHYFLDNVIRPTYSTYFVTLIIAERVRL